MFKAVATHMVEQAETDTSSPSLRVYSPEVLVVCSMVPRWGGSTVFITSFLIFLIVFFLAYFLSFNSDLINIPFLVLPFFIILLLTNRLWIWRCFSSSAGQERAGGHEFYYTASGGQQRSAERTIWRLLLMLTCCWRLAAWPDPAMDIYDSCCDKGRL